MSEQGPSTSTPLGNDHERWANMVDANSNGELTFSSTSDTHSDLDSFFNISIPSYCSSSDDTETEPEIETGEAINNNLEVPEQNKNGFSVYLNRKSRRIVRSKLPRNKRKKLGRINAKLHLLLQNDALLSDKRRAENLPTDTPLAKRRPVFTINDGSNTKETAKPNATIINGELNTTMDDLDEDTQTVAVLSETEDEDLTGLPDAAAEKILRQKEALNKRAEEVRRREQRLLRAEQWAREQEARRLQEEADRNRLEEDRRLLEEQKAEEERLRKEAEEQRSRSRTALEAAVADPQNTSLGEEHCRILWFYTSHDNSSKPPRLVSITCDASTALT